MDRIDRLAALFRRRWACPVIAELHRAEGAKFVTLTSRLGASAGAMRETLDELVERGWVRRNPGYGHPLRPEYLLTAAGERVGPACADLDGALAAPGVKDVALRRWSMPVLYVVGEGPTRFSDVTHVLEGATDRAVSLALKDLSSVAIVRRELVPGPPIGTSYGATAVGARLLPILDRV